MQRVTDISKIIVPGGHVLIRIHKKPESRVLLPDGADLSSDSNTDYAEVVQVSEDVTNLKPGDIVLDFHTQEAFKWDDQLMALVFRNNIKLAIDKKYFNFNMDITE